jgi:hypothetical protein
MLVKWFDKYKINLTKAEIEQPESATVDFAVSEPRSERTMSFNPKMV